MPHQTPHVRLAVVMPLGPRDDATDTIDSIRAFTNRSRVIVVVDDTRSADKRAALERYDDVDVVTAADHPGPGGLYVKLGQGLRRALELASFDVLLRIDADALVIGPRPEDDALAYFADHPEVGIIGSHVFDCDGGRRDFAPPARVLRREMGLAGLRRPALRATLRAGHRAAARHGYEAGENCLGGAAFFSPPCVVALAENGWLDRPELAGSRLNEDQLFALFARACGFGLDDFATGDRPMGLRWHGLPCSPQELLDRGKKITHSVRSWEDLDEEAIRSFFGERRPAFS